MNEIFPDDVFKTLGIAIQQGVKVWIVVDETGDIDNLSEYQLSTIISKNGVSYISVINPHYSGVAGDSKTKMINKKIIIGYSFDNLHFQYVNGEYM